jgi:hypothetical protein
MVPQLSVEILELIIDHTAAYVRSEWYNFLYLDEEDSTLALRACALTCSALRPRAHHHLYTSARITKDKHAGDLLDIVNRRPTLAGCVQTLEIMPEPGVPKDYRQSLVGPLPLFTNLTHLIFSGVHFADLRDHEASIDDVTKHMPSSVRKLSFFGCEFQDDTTIANIIWSVADLHTLSVEQCIWRAWKSVFSPVSQASLVSPQVYTIHATWDSSSISRPWMTVLSLSSLTEVQFNMPNYEDVAGWQAVLFSAPHIIKVTILQIETDQFEPVLDFHNQRQLESLRIELDFKTPADFPDPDTAFLAFLTSTRSESLSLLHITLDCIAKPQLEQIDWENVKTVVEEAHWKSAPKLVIQFVGESELEPVTKEIKGALLEKWRCMGVDWLHMVTHITD